MTMTTQERIDTKPMEKSVWERIAEDNAARSSRWAEKCGEMRAQRDIAWIEIVRLEQQTARLREAMDSIANALDPLEEAVNALDRHDIEIRGLTEALADLQDVYYERRTT